MVYLLPVSHDVQLGSHDLSDIYRKFLTYAISRLKISLICEELSEDDIKAGVHSYIAKNVAERLGIPYLLCEPSDEERKRLGIPLNEEINEKLQNLIQEAKLTGSYPAESFEKFRQEMTIANQKREKYWLDKIKDKKDETILFVVGIGHFSFYRDVHGEGFDKLLVGNGFKIDILPTQFVNPKYLKDKD